MKINDPSAMEKILRECRTIAVVGLSFRAVSAIAALRQEKLSVISLQEHHA